jgi:hypothetical protein
MLQLQYEVVEVVEVVEVAKNQLNLGNLEDEVDLEVLHSLLLIPWLISRYSYLQYLHLKKMMNVNH